MDAMVNATPFNSEKLPIELRLVKDTARRFADESLRPLAAQRAGMTELPMETRRAFVELGLGLAHVPQAVGGLGLGPIASCLTDESLAAGDINAAFALPHPGAFVDLVALLGNRHQRKVWLHPFLHAAEATWGAFAMAAPGELTAQAHGDTLLLSGRAPAVWFAAQADRLAVVADEVDAQGQATGRRLAMVVEREDDGVELQPEIALLGLPMARALPIAFNKVRVVRSQWLMAAHVDEALRHVFCAQALRMASLSLGTARAASAYVLDYAEKRRRAGSPPAHYQSMGFLLVDMHLAAETALGRLRQAAQKAVAASLCNAALKATKASPWVDAIPPKPLPRDFVAFLYKLRAEADEVAYFVTDSALQMLAEGQGEAAAAPSAHPVAGWHKDVGLLTRCYPTALVDLTPLPAVPAGGEPHFFT